MSSKSWVDGPYTLISSSKSGDSLENPATGARRMAAEMSLVHNVLIRGINAVYIQCENVVARGTTQDKEDFVNFASLWGELIHEHHDLEEKTIFTEIDQLCGVPGLMDANVDEHKLFHAGLKEYTDYLSHVKAGEQAFDGAKLRGIIDSFMPVVHEHLSNEINTLVSLEKYADKVDWGDWFKKTTNKIGSDAMSDARYRTNVFPLAIIFHDKSFEGGIWQKFPPLPRIAMLALQWLFMRTHRNWWRFAGCDFYSQPKELPFA